AARSATAVVVQLASEARKSQPGFGAVPPPMATGMSVTRASPFGPVTSHRRPSRSRAVAGAPFVLALPGSAAIACATFSSASRISRPGMCPSIGECAHGTRATARARSQHRPAGLPRRLGFPFPGLFASGFAFLLPQQPLVQAARGELPGLPVPRDRFLRPPIVPDHLLDV